MKIKTESKSHPKHYLMHKYWGRKSHSFVSDYIKAFTQKGDTVLDPFMGSGVVIIEANKLHRKSVGVDLNPVSVFITNNTLSVIDFKKLREEFEKIIKNIPEELLDLEKTNCPKCKSLVDISNAIWNKDNLIKIKGYCNTHGTFIKTPDNFDLKQTIHSKKILKKYEENGFSYPKNKILSYVRRSGITQIDELFSERNLVLISYLAHQIKKVKNKEVSSLLKMAFTSMLPNVSKMIPGDEQMVTGKSGWQISKFWIPGIHTEKNVLDSFKLRFEKIYNGKKEIEPLLTDSVFTLHNENSENLHFINSNSIDYIFTDPPYGESIAYLGLSMMWNTWLDFDVDYQSEIIYDLTRKKDHADYRTRLINAYSEMFRVLKPGKYLSFTFHNRNLNFWKTIIDSCLLAGFELENINWQPQAVASGTQGLNRKNTLHGDFVYNFLKPLKKSNKPLKEINGEDIVYKATKKLIDKYDFIETSKLYEKLIPEIVKKMAFLDSNNKILDIDNFLLKHFKYEEVKFKDEKKYGWTK